jgi:hypothetical protein
VVWSATDDEGKRCEEGKPHHDGEQLEKSRSPFFITTIDQTVSSMGVWKVVIITFKTSTFEPRVRLNVHQHALDIPTSLLRAEVKGRFKPGAAGEAGDIYTSHDQNGI